MQTDELGRLLFTTGEQYPIPAGLPGGFQARQIIYREFDSLTRPTRHYYVDIDKPTPCQPGVNIDAFVGNIARNGYTRNRPDAREVKPLDIPVYRDSYIILQLHQASGFTFDAAEYGISLTTRSADPPNNIYGRVRYVDSTGTVHGGPIPNCRLLFFAARHVAGDEDNPHRQGLNYNLVTIDGDVTIIDPDVRHPGVGGELP